METDEKSVAETAVAAIEEPSQAAHIPSENGEPIRVESDLNFIGMLGKQTGDFFIKCFQCGTCSATCTLSPDTRPFPRKEMAWASWGMKDMLIRDPDVWLCYQCNDCSTRCPRGARPGDVLAAVRKESVINHAFPRFLGRWVNEPQSIPLLLAIPVILLGLALAVKEPIERLLGISYPLDEAITFSYSSLFPHWLLNSFFFFFSLLVLLAAIIGVRRFWQSLKTNAIDNTRPAKGLFPSIVSVAKNIITHDNFTKCTTERPRYFSHLLVFFGFFGLLMVTLWVITSGINPLIKDNFIYPFGFWSPWKILANVGGLALIIGLSMMIRDRLRENKKTGSGTYFDWALIATLFIVVLTGFATEVLHYIRLEPHRHVIYFVHLVFVFTLLMYLPYSKFAHLIYRTVAMVYSEYSGRNESTTVAPKQQNVKTKV